MGCFVCPEKPPAPPSSPSPHGPAWPSDRHAELRPIGALRKKAGEGALGESHPTIWHRKCPAQNILSFAVWRSASQMSPKATFLFSLKACNISI